MAKDDNEMKRMDNEMTWVDKEVNRAME